MAELERLEEHRARIEDWLHACFQDCAPRGNLYDAMRYSLLAGGKRLRPVLVLEACRLCGGAVEDALPFAGAIEMIHTYSLIHDDLPCMDDDDLRRGRPTNHKVFGEANAVLAGDGLLTAAFETMLAPGQKLPPERVLEAAGILARAAGGRGMVGGQVLDMAGEGRALGLTEVEELQRLKTGALIRAAVEMGCAVAGGAEEQREALCRYADCLGLAFQIQDDILDVVGDEATLGKPIGSDVRSDKTTFVALKGLADCRILVAELTDRAVEALAPFGSEAESLSILAWAIAQVLKFVITLISQGKLDWRHILSSGGMPSSHSAFVCACAAAMGYMYGWASPVFTISAVVAIVVMYDAANVRKAAGEQAKILNYIMEHWTEMKPAIFGKELKEFLGHTPFQVLMGGLLGISVGLLGAWLWT